MRYLKMRLTTLKDITDEDLLNILLDFKRYALLGDFKDKQDLKDYIEHLRGVNNG
jgi:hypothetical protein